MSGAQQTPTKPECDLCARCRVSEIFSKARCDAHDADCNDAGRNDFCFDGATAERRTCTRCRCYNNGRSQCIFHATCAGDVVASSAAMRRRWLPHSPLRYGQRPVMMTSFWARPNHGSGCCRRSGSNSGALAVCKHTRLGARELRPIIEERRGPTEPAYPPTENPRGAAGEKPE